MAAAGEFVGGLCGGAALVLGTTCIIGLVVFHPVPSLGR
jgi:hypothetical protein